ncbi:MAG: hypothetical protein F4117_12825 [Acidimicrobiales bacterium]|nr:hypothetical protein [Acidimicrobiales bacterium]MYA81525.1 hypothetical protein [Acidimicrobiales bacterium]MYB82339.1 hypothetical protein [Acidimicrobiales bacterium]MYH74315.1 hypothetical protein [Acidimicrobiales bacterium]MYI13430.1 hypothetical protein [Acidimicrobiales bacterium]
MRDATSRCWAAVVIVVLASAAGACTGPPLRVAPTPSSTSALSLDITATTLLPSRTSSERPAAVLVTAPAGSDAGTASDAAAATTAPLRLGGAAVPRPEGVVLASDGLGLVPFGTDAQAALDVLTRALGQPVADSGWTDTFSIYGDCPGSRLRAVEWPGLLALFGNAEDGYQHRDAGDEHFMTWRLGAFGPDPYMLQTAEGIGVGAGRAEVAEAYPTATFHPATVNESASVSLVTSGGRLVGVFDEAGVLRSLEAGTRCPIG